MSLHAALIALSLTLPGAAAPAKSGWRYVVPPADDPFAHAPLRALALSGSRPADLKETALYRGTHRRYARLVYGTGRTAAVAIVLDFIAGGGIDLYVDANRDSEITDKDGVAGSGPAWRLPLKAVVHAGEQVREYPRTVCLRYGPVSRTLAAATCGYVEGEVTIDGRRLAARRVDGDHNGLFADAQDRVWVDLDGDGRFEAAAEEFLFAPILRPAGKRLVVRADALGERLELAALEGTGKVKLALPALRPAQIQEVQVTVQSKDGVVASLRSLDGEATVPTGEYRISSVLLTLADPAGGPAWGYVFNDNGGKGPTWHRLDKDGTLTLDPIGKLAFAVTVEDGKAVCRPGQMLTVRPALYTQDGLLIERAYRGAFGEFASGCAGQIGLHAGERVLDRASSGFA